MKDIFLISPWVDQLFRMQITSLSLIKYYLQDHGYTATIIDCANYPKDLNEVLEIIGKSKDPIIGVTAYSRERFHAYDLIRKVKAHIPKATVVVGGRHFGFLAEETLSELPEVDIVVRGEGEITFKEICDAIYLGTDLNEIQGMSFRSKERIIHNPDRPFERNLDLFRSYDCKNKTDMNPKSLLGHTIVDHSNHYFSVHATRGCPNKCVYCSLTSSMVRFRSIDGVILEIKDKIAATGVRNVSFTDSSLTINKSYITELCNAIIDNDLKIRWRCYSRVNIDIELLKLMRKAGLDAVEIGLETGSPKVLKAIRKNITHKQVSEFVKQAHQLGVKVLVFCMTSLPEETYDDATMTVDYVAGIAKYIDVATLQTTRITPDAALFSIAKEKGILPQGFNWFQPYETPYSEVPARPGDESLPIYIEFLSVSQIKDVHRKFKEITSTELASFSYFIFAAKCNLRLEALKRLTPALFFAKARVAFSLLFNSVRNMLVK